MSLFKAPVGIIEQLDKIRRRFLWGGSELKKKIHWVEWSKVIVPKSEGGLGVGSLFAQNIALLIKWWWRIMNDKGSLWKGVIMSIHNLYNKLASYIARKTSNGVWCNISKAVRALDSLHIDCKDIFALTPGSDVNILFWKDSWCSNIPFHLKFPHLYSIETDKNCLLGDRISSNGFSWMWRFEPTSSEELSELL